MQSLGVAIVFAALLNLVLLFSFFWAESAWSSWCGYGWAAVVTFWAFGVWQARQQRASSHDSAQAHNQQDLFIRAQSEYLKGQWIEAQSLLEQLISQNPGDVESHLLLSSVFRRSRRIDLAHSQLHRLCEFEGANQWRFEIERERALLQRLPASGA